MKDQAERLRQIIKNLEHSKFPNKIVKNKRNTRVLAITSGKGGVGKTNFTVNLAISLSNLGYKVVIFDADIGLANIDIVLGIMPKYTIADVLSGSKKLTDVTEEGPNGIKIIAGGSGIKELMDIDETRLSILTNQLINLENYADFILIDTGAGISNTVLSFVKAADEIILITTPEPTSLTDVYAMIKVLALEGLSSKFHIVINKVENNLEADEVYSKLSKVVNRFLKLDVEILGYIYNSKLIVDSIKNQNPITILHPNSNVSKKINNIALKLVGHSDIEQQDTGIRNFVNKFRQFLMKEGKY